MKQFLLFLLFTALSLNNLSAGTKTWFGGIDDWSIPANWSPMGVPGNTDTVYFATGHATVDGDIDIAGLYISGGTIFAPTWNLDISGDLIWTAGEIFAISTTVDGATIFAGPSFKTIKCDINSNGGGYWSGGVLGTRALNWQIASGTTYTFHTDTAQTIQMITGGHATIHVYGLLHKTGMGTITPTAKLHIRNDGEIRIDEGRLVMREDNTHTGHFQVNSDTGITFLFNTQTLLGTTAGGNGKIYLYGSKVISSGGTSELPGLIMSTGSFVQDDQDLLIKGDLVMEDGGFLGTGTATVTIQGKMYLQDGGVGEYGGTSAGSVIVNDSLFLTTNGNKNIWYKTLIALGGGYWNDGNFYCNNATFHIPMGKSFDIDLAATKSMTRSSTIYDHGSLLIEGYLTKKGTGTVNIDSEVQLLSGGTIVPEEGIMRLRGTNCNYQGTFDLNSATNEVMQFTSGTHILNGNSVLGTATLRQSGGDLSLNGMGTVSTLHMTGGNFIGSGTLNGDVVLNGSIPEFGRDTGDITINGNLQFDWGTIGSSDGQSAGEVVVLGSTDFGSNFAKLIHNKTLVVNDGAWAQGTIQVDNDGIFKIAAGGTFAFSLGSFASMTKKSAGSTYGKLLIEGTLYAIGTSVPPISVEVENNGTIGGYNALNLNNTFNNNGTISPGINGIGALKLTHSPDIVIDTLYIEADGNAVGNLVDSLHIVGDVDLTNATLVVVENPCLPTGTFDFLTWTGTRINTFQNLVLPPKYIVSYDNTAKKARLHYSNPLTGVDALVLDSTQAVVYWDITPDAGFFKIQYRIKGTSSWTLVNVPNRDYQRRNWILENLEKNTTYEYRVRQQCPDLTSGPYSSIQEFTTFTSSACDIPEKSVIGFTPDPTRVVFFADYEPEAEKYNVRWRVVGTAQPIESRVHKNARAGLTGLTPGTTYEYRYRALCNGVWTAYSAWIPFTTNDASPRIAPRLQDDTVGNEAELSERMLHLYPNPTNNLVFLDFGNEETPIIVRIYNALGQQVIEHNPSNTISQIVLDALPLGQYFIVALWPDGYRQNAMLLKE